jgi:predicted enzyme related to lactoylglutathione lyase
MLSQPIGSIGWVDLTVPECDAIRSFYERVVGWTSQPVAAGHRRRRQEALRITPAFRPPDRTGR